jgi:ADP-ribose pyrophosphatase YjhB (NUDIX family)
MVKRRREPFKGTWMFPSGFVEFGEHPEESAAREVLEETGLKTVRLDLINVFQSEDDPRLLGHFVFFYRVETIGDSIRTDNEENEGIDWFDPIIPPEVAWKWHKHVLNQLALDNDHVDQ